MSSKGKVYVKHLEQAKYVVKGKKLKTYIVTIKEKKASSNTQMNYIYKNIDVNNIDIYEEKSKNDYLQNNEQYSEVEFEIEEDDIVEEEKVEIQISTKDEALCSMKDNELTKEQVDAKVIEIKQREKEALERYEKAKQNEDIEKKMDKLVTAEERTKGIINEKKENVSKSQLDELERLRLLELARVKKETIEKEKIEKAKAKKEEKIKQEIKQKSAKDNVRLLQDKLDSVDKRKKARKDESKTFVIVAALLAIIIVAGIINIGGVMLNEIKKDNILVGETKKDDKEENSLFDNLYENINGFNNKNNDEKLDEKNDETTTNKQEDDELGVADNIVVADSTDKKVNNTNSTGNNVNKNNLMESIENIKLPVGIEESTPDIKEDINNNLGEETGATTSQQEKYVEVQYSGTDFKLYTTSKSNIKKSVVIAGGCKQYTGYKFSNGIIQIPQADAEGLWFIVKNSKLEAEFAITNNALLGVASIVLINDKDGAEIEEDVIYAKQGTSVALGATYYIKDEEGKKISDYEVVNNVLGSMILYRE